MADEAYPTSDTRPRLKDMTTEQRKRYDAAIKNRKRELDTLDSGPRHPLLAPYKPRKVAYADMTAEQKIIYDENQKIKDIQNRRKLKISNDQTLMENMRKK